MWRKVRELLNRKLENRRLEEEDKVDEMDKREMEEDITTEILELKELIKRGLDERIKYREELRLKLSDAQRLKEYKEAQLPLANDIDAEILRDEIESINNWIAALMDIFKSVTEEISEGKRALMSLQILELNLNYFEKFSNENWKEAIKRIREKMENDGDIPESFKALCSEVNKLVDRVKIKIEVLGKRKKEKELELQ